MSAKVIDGKKIAEEIKLEVKIKIKNLKGRKPKLAVILVGDDPASKVYVSGKEKDCNQVGIINETIIYDSDINENELISKIKELNQDSEVDGILVQLPLPKHINTQKVINTIDPNKDVDGFHPMNLGGLISDSDCFIPCTPKGVMKVLDSIGMNDLSGKKALMVGRSNIVGKPLAQLLIKHNATVTIAHSKTASLIEELKDQDIVIVAIGKEKYIKADWLKPGCVVIDVGINRMDNGKLCGDVDFDSCCEVASYITPVPKGVGPLTRAMLMENTLEAYMKREK